MIRFILFLILFYIIYKVLQYFLRALTTSSKNSQDSFKRNPPEKSKYKDVEEADFREINPDDKDDNNEKK
jgi:hypothetical protein